MVHRKSYVRLSATGFSVAPPMPESPHAVERATAHNRSSRNGFTSSSLLGRARPCKAQRDTVCVYDPMTVSD